MCENFFGKEKYISEFTCYQKLHFCTPVTCKGSIIWCMIVCQTYLGYNFVGWGGIFLTLTLPSKDATTPWQEMPTASFA